jgi:hypothetical protein
MKTVMVDHPEHGSDYLAAHYRPLAWQVAGLQKTASGYGTKIPTRYTVTFQGKERRIYADYYSNVAATYIIVNGEKVFVR